jgi:tripartite-type tricarboxylate transporter receptor subunit TctC
MFKFQRGLCLGAWVLSLFSFAQSAVAQTAATGSAGAYPSKPIRIIVPAGAGGITDLLARIVGQKLAENVGQQVLIDNRVGASGIVGSEIVAKAPPDGYLLLMVFPSHPANPSLFAKMPYDTVNDFAPITMVSGVQLVLTVTQSLPAKSVKELIVLAKSNPGVLNYGTTGKGSLGHLAAELFRSMSGAQITHVPYKGAPQVITALISGEIGMFFDPPITAVPQVKAGKTRALGVSTTKRLAVLPDVPTVAEAGVPGFEVLGWNGILAPAATPKPIIDKLHAEIIKVLRSPDIVERFTQNGAQIIANTPTEFSAIVKADVAKWAKVIQSAGIRPE